MSSRRMRRLLLGERKESEKRKEREEMVVVIGWKTGVLYKEGWGRVMEGLPRRVL